VAAKLYRYFVREEISSPVKAELGRGFRDSGYQMKPLLKRIFLSKDFYSPPSYATQIKSPVHLVVSTYKKMGLREVPTIPDFGRMTAGLGQALFDPPNVAGWAGGNTWITQSQLLQRGNRFRDVLFPGGAQPNGDRQGRGRRYGREGRGSFCAPFPERAARRQGPGGTGRVSSRHARHQQHPTE